MSPQSARRRIRELEEANQRLRRKVAQLETQLALEKGEWHRSSMQRQLDKMTPTADDMAWRVR